VPTSATAKPDDRLPLYLRLHDALQARIEQGEWKPGTVLPAETSLTEEYGVALGTMRKAIDQLAAAGLVERQQGRGTFVRRPQFGNSLFRFFRLQDKAGQPMQPASHILGRGLEPLPAAAAAGLGLAEGAPGIRLARLRLVDGEPILAEEVWLDPAVFGDILTLPVEAFGVLLYPLYEERFGQLIVTAEEDLSVETAEPGTAHLLGMAPGSPVIVIERQAFGYGRRPLEWRRSIGPAERFRYHVEIR
jgi:GntR family transcriptional regulator